MATHEIKRFKLGTQGLEVSAQGLGCMSMTTGYGPAKPEDDMIKLIRQARKVMIVAIRDTRLREWLQSFRKDTTLRMNTTSSNSHESVYKRNFSPPLQSINSSIELHTNQICIKHIKSEFESKKVPRGVRKVARIVLLKPTGISRGPRRPLYPPARPPPTSDTHLITLLHHAITTGVTLLDTADMYGPFINELLISKALEGDWRGKVELATKFGMRMAEEKGKIEVVGDPGYVKRVCRGLGLIVLIFIISIGLIPGFRSKSRFVFLDGHQLFVIVQSEYSANGS